MKKILIIKLAAIGDVIMALPMLTEIEKDYPGAQVTWVIGRQAVSILKCFPVNIVCIDDKKLLSGNLWDKVRVILSLWWKLAFKYFDLIVVGHTDPRYRLLTMWTRGTKRFFLKKQQCRYFPVGTRHFTDEYVRLVSNDDCRLEPALSTVLPALKLDKIDLLMQPLKGKKVIAFAPGGAKNVLADDKIRRWPIENYVELAQILLTRGFQVVITGATTDDWVLPYFKNLAVVNLVGQTNLLELVGVFQHCNLVITHDSGPMHLAGLSGSPILALFGPTNPYEKIPRGKQPIKFIWEGEKYACCPCYDGKTYAACQDNVCLKNITAQRVYEEALSLMHN